MLLDALERGDSDTARSISVVQIERRRRWIERLRTGGTADTPADTSTETSIGEQPLVAEQV